MLQNNSSQEISHQERSGSSCYALMFLLGVIFGVIAAIQFIQDKPSDGLGLGFLSIFIFFIFFYGKHAQKIANNGTNRDNQRRNDENNQLSIFTVVHSGQTNQGMSHSNTNLEANQGTSQSNGNLQSSRWISCVDLPSACDKLFSDADY